MRKLYAGFLIFSLVFLNLTAVRAQTRGAGVKLNTKTSDKRLALVIGNSAYQNIDKLKNPVNDATDIAAELKKLGFEVVLGTDLTLAQMRKMVREFGVRLQQERGFGLFYYAGHGVQVEGRNYLVPVEANIQTAVETQDSALDSDTVLRFMRDAGNEFNLIIMDACRNNPFADSWRKYSPNRAIGENKGLAKVTPPSGTIILYSTEPGSTASDGSGRNGLFTESLLTQIDKPNVEFDQMVKLLLRDVRQKSGGAQSPWKEGLYDGDFYFAGIENTVPTSSVKPVENAVIEKDRAAVEQEAWLLIQSSASTQDYKDFLKEFPTGANAVKAKIRIEDLTWNTVKDSSDKTKIQAYLTEFPNGVNAPLARIKLKQLTSQNRFANVTALNLDKTRFILSCPAGYSSTSCTADQIVNVRTTAIDPENSVLTYSYSVSGGRITGQGANINWDLTGVRPGTYTITAAVDNGLGFMGNPKTQSVTVAECLDCRAPSAAVSCPTISISGPSGVTPPGDSMTFTANVSGGSQEGIFYNWSISAGTIESGQGTPVITTSTTGLENTSITATVEVGGISSACSKTGSATGMVAASPKASMIVDLVGVKTANEIKANLDAFYTALANDPTAHGVIAQSGTDREVAQREKIIRDAITFRVYDITRISFARFSSTPGIKTQFYLVPAGAPDPQP